MIVNFRYFDLKQFKILKWDSRSSGHWNCLKGPNNSTGWLTPAFKGCVGCSGLVIVYPLSGDSNRDQDGASRI